MDNVTLNATKEITYADKEAVMNVKAAYDALGEEEQAQVTNGETLLGYVADMEAMEKAIADAQVALDAVPTATDVTVEDADAINAAREAYDALNDLQSYVTGYDNLVAAELALAALQEEIDRAAAKVVEDMIDALPTATDVANEEAIKDAEDAYAALTPVQQAYVSNYAALLDARTALNALKADREVAADVEALIDALPTPTDIDADDKEAVEAARAAYDALTDAQKALVGNLAKLEAAEAALPVGPALEDGDVNNDGEIDAADALEVLKHAVGKITLDEAHQEVADVNGDENIDAADALDILKYAVGKITEFSKNK